jgi:hypothetical protein
MLPNCHLAKHQSTRSQQVYYTHVGRTHQDDEEVSYADTDSFNPIPLHDMSDDDDTDANKVQKHQNQNGFPTYRQYVNHQVLGN